MKKAALFLAAFALCLIMAVPLSTSSVSAAGGYGEYFYTAFDRVVFFSYADVDTRTIRQKTGSREENRQVTVVTLHPDCKITVRPGAGFSGDEDVGEWPSVALAYSWTLADGVYRLSGGENPFLLSTGDSVDKLFSQTGGSQLLALGTGSGEEIFLAADVSPSNGQWEQSGGKWGFTLDSGEKAAGRWLKDGGNWYQFDQNGVMRTGWYQDSDQSWYYFQGNGTMKTGWLRQGDAWYYLNPASGEMISGIWYVIGGSYYHFRPNGAMQKGWFRDKDGSWSYFQDSGAALCSGWAKIGGKDYYFYENGVMAANTTIDGCQLGKDGAWVK